MEDYLQQCLDYHNEQELLRQTHDFEVADTTAVLFVKSTDPIQASFEEASPDDMGGQPTVVAESPSLFAAQVEEGRARAQAILDRFQQQQTNLLGSSIESEWNASLNANTQDVAS